MKSLIVFLFVASLIFAIVGFWRGWFDMSVSDAETDEVHVGLDVDKRKLKDDAREVVEKAKDLVDSDPGEERSKVEEPSGASPSSASPLEGRAVSVARDSVKLLTASDIVEVVHLTAETDVRLTGARTSLKEGDVLRVTWHEENGRKIAEAVTLK